MSDQEEVPVYGNCLGPESMYVKLISSDGYEFILKRDHALVSNTIRAMLSGPEYLAEDTINEIRLQIPSYLMHQICRYFAYKRCYDECEGTPPPFDVLPRISLELLLFVDFLDC